MWWLELNQKSEVEPGAPGNGVIHPLAIVSDSATIDTSKGPVSIGAGSRICPGAYVQGPTAIGENSLIGNNAMVRGATTIGNNCIVGFSAEIKNAVIKDGVSIGPMCFVADSVLEPEVYLGALVRTSNHRLDKKTIASLHETNLVDTGMDKLGCHIGAGSSLGVGCIILPGRIIQSGCMFGPRVTIEKNLPRGNYRIKQTIETF